jgi:hypothetical protein
MDTSFLSNSSFILKRMEIYLGLKASLAVVLD